MRPMQTPFLSEPMPCDDCKLTDICADHLFACEAFHQYVQGEDWSDCERYPGRDWLVATFKHDMAAYRRAYYATKRRRAA